MRTSAVAVFGALGLSLYALSRGQPEALRLSPEVVLATPVASFHNVTLQIYRAVLERRGYRVHTITDRPHPDMYRSFTGSGVPPTIDIVVSSDLPNNHAPWLANHTDTFDVIGTCYELLHIFLAAPTYAGLASLTDAAASTTLNKTIVGFDLDPCARCPDLAHQWISARLPGFSYHPVPKTEIEAVLAGKLAAKEHFLTTLWSPSFYNALFPQLKALDMEEFAPALFNQGKALLRKASRPKLDEGTLAALGAVFIGTDALNRLDYEVSQSKSPNAPEEVARAWIQKNQKTFDMFFW